MPRYSSVIALALFNLAHADLESRAPSSFSLSWKAQGTGFFDNFDWFTDKDPTHGIVRYVNRNTAISNKLAQVDSQGKAIMRVDASKDLALNQLRDSVRITAKRLLQIGEVLIADFDHVPFGEATWPAFWTLGDINTWPSRGEIDIFEGVNTNTQNLMTLHTTAGCQLKMPMKGTGKVKTTNCDVKPTGNVGCGVQDPSTTSYGDGFNKNGGGVFATAFLASGISIWFFPRGSIPSDIKSGTLVNPSSWGQPKAFFSSETCNIPKYFGPQTIVFDTTLCGDWAGSAYKGPGTCAERVRKGANFKNAYWSVNYVKVFSPKK